MDYRRNCCVATLDIYRAGKPLSAKINPNTDRTCNMLGQKGKIQDLQELFHLFVFGGTFQLEPQQKQRNAIGEDSKQNVKLLCLD